MAGPLNKPTPKDESSVIQGKDLRTQAEKDKHLAAEKQEKKKDSSGKSSEKTGGCC